MADEKETRKYEKEYKNVYPADVWTEKGRVSEGAIVKMTKAEYESVSKFFEPIK